VAVITTAQITRRAALLANERQPATQRQRQRAFRRATLLANAAACESDNELPPTGARRVAVSRKQKISARDINNRAAASQDTSDPAVNGEIPRLQ